MTEQEWLTCTDPVPMLEFLRGRANDRKWQLFACNCVNRLHNLLVRLLPALPGCREEDHVRHLVSSFNPEILKEVERRADDGSNCKNTAVFLNLFRRAGGGRWFIGTSKYKFAVFAEEVVGWTLAIIDTNSSLGIAERAELCNLLRDIIGSPYRPVGVDSAWLTPTVTQLAEAIYRERAFERLPVLADALEDAGCISQDILSHCRQPGEHVRGCWALDLILAKE